MKKVIWFIARIIAWCFGIPDIRQAERYAKIVLWVLGGVLIAAALLFLLTLRSCYEPSLNQDKILEQQREIDRIERESLSNAFNSVDNGRVKTNEDARRAEEDSENINRRDYSNTNLDAANAARCKAFNRGCK